MSTIYQTIIITLLVAFVILTLTKLELRSVLRDKCDAHGLKLLAKMFDCDFCFGFWLALVFAIIISIITQCFGWLITPFLAASLIRILL